MQVWLLAYAGEHNLSKSSSCTSIMMVHFSLGFNGWPASRTYRNPRATRRYGVRWHPLAYAGEQNQSKSWSSTSIMMVHLTLVFKGWARAEPIEILGLHDDLAYAGEQNLSISLSCTSIMMAHITFVFKGWAASRAYRNPRATRRSSVRWYTMVYVE